MTTLTTSLQHNGTEDVLYTEVDTYYPVTAIDLPIQMSIVPIHTTIPSSGQHITCTVEWKSNTSDTLQLNIQLLDATPFSFNPSLPSVVGQVVGPGQGSITLTFPVVSSIDPTRTYQFHTFTTAVNGPFYPYLHEEYYPLTVINDQTLMTVSSPPSTIPSSGNITLTLQWRSNIQDTLLVHLDLQDITQSYALVKGVVGTVVGPGAGSITLTIPLVGSIDVNDRYQLHTYITSLTNSTTYGASNDAQHAFVDHFYPVIISDAHTQGTQVSLSPTPLTVPVRGSVSYGVVWQSLIYDTAVVHVDLI
jgi:hypothetical protein